MRTDPLDIRPDILADLHALAIETRRSERDMINEALARFLLRERHALVSRATRTSEIVDVIERIKANRASRDLGDLDPRAAIEDGRD
jgi:hypothetical protein